MTLGISLSRVFFPVTTLGPGQRVGIWFQGCSIRCPGCISADTWPQKSALMTVSELIQKIIPLLHEADGVTISGGEPFEQLPALKELLQSMRALLRPESDVLVYSGFTMTELQAELPEFSGLIDALITGPFVREAGQTRPLMGSDNQELHLLSERGHTKFTQYFRRRDATDDRFDLLMDEDGTAWLAGIPKQGDFERLRSVLLDQGMTFQTTEDRQLRS